MVSFCFAPTHPGLVRLLSFTSSVKHPVDGGVLLVAVTYRL